MANQIAHANTNHSSTGTWLTTATGLDQIAGVTRVTVTTSSVDGTAFVPGIQNIQGLCLQLSRRIGITGTLIVTLRNTTAGADAGSVTINCSDLPAETAVCTNADAAVDGSWHFFDFVTPVTTLAANNYTVRVRATSANMVELIAATADWNRLVVTSSAPGSLAAADRFWVGQSYTGAGAATPWAVTQDENNTTAWGEHNISNGGTLNASVAGATQFRLSGNLKGWGGGTTNFGTVGSPCVLGQPTIVEFNTASDGQFGGQFFWNHSLSLYGASKTAVINTLAADVSAAATSLTLGTNVGASWKNNDQIVIAGTTRTAAETEVKVLGADASGTAVGTIAALANAHSGTSPTIANVCNISRDLKFRTVGGSASANGTYLWWNPNYTGTTVIYWGEFINFGSNISFKRGIETDMVAGNLDMENCSIHDMTETGASAFYALGGSGSQVYNFSNNIIYNYRSGFTNTATTATGWTVSGNVAAAIGAGGAGFLFADIGGTMTNNIAFGCTNVGGINIAEAAAIGTFSGNTTYNNSVPGLAVTQFSSGTILNHTSWRNNTFGITLTGQNSYAGPTSGLIIDTYVCFGNATAGSNAATCVNPITFVNSTWNAGVTLTQPVGHSVSANSNFGNVTFRNCTFGVTTTHATADINFNATSSAQIYTENCLLSSATPVGGITFMATTNCFVQHDKYQQIAGNWLRVTKLGSSQPDATTLLTSPVSVKMFPLSATNKLQSSPMQIRVNNGKVATVSCAVVKNSPYAGNQIQMVVLANAAMGVNTDTVIATGSLAVGSVETLSGAISAATQTGTFDVVIRCDGTTGSINYGDASAVST